MWDFYWNLDGFPGALEIFFAIFDSKFPYFLDFFSFKKFLDFVIFQSFSGSVRVRRGRIISEGPAGINPKPMINLTGTPSIIKLRASTNNFLDFYLRKKNFRKKNINFVRFFLYRVFALCNHRFFVLDKRQKNTISFVEKSHPN